LREEEKKENSLSGGSAMAERFFFFFPVWFLYQTSVIFYIALLCPWDWLAIYQLP
jgi:hypothetical protein